MKGTRVMSEDSRRVIALIFMGNFQRMAMQIECQDISYQYPQTDTAYLII